MTEDRKQELTQLLEEAIANLEIRLNSTNSPQLSSVIDIHQYKSILQQSWKNDSLNTSLLVMCYKAHIAGKSIELQLLDFIRTEYAQFINEEDRIQSACSFIARGGPSGGFSLDSLLEQLLKIAIVYGVEKAVLDFGRGVGNGHQSFQYVALLEGIRVEAEIQVFEGVRLVPLPLSTSELSNYLPDNVNFFMSPHSLMGKTLLIIDASVFPTFHKPYPELFNDDFHEDRLPFHVEVADGRFSNFKVEEFYKHFCQALSLSGNSAVQIVLDWRRLPPDEFFNLNILSVNHISQPYHTGELHTFVDSTEDQIQKTKCLYDILADSKMGIRKKLQIPIDRWIKSKAERNPVDKIIDLGIAFEAFYLSETDYNREIRFRFSLHAAWHLGKNKEQRKALIKEFKAIYDWRSTVVHTGKLPEKGSGKKKKPYPPEEIGAFITKAQDLCRDSIMKILEDGKFPDWNSLILG